MPFFENLKKKSKNMQFLIKHRKDLILRYTEYVQTIKSTDLTPKMFYDFSHAESFLCHLATGYREIYSLLVNYMLLKKEIDSQPMSESVWREKTKQADSIALEYKHAIDMAFLKVLHGSEEFEGICHQCTPWYDENDPNFKGLIFRLKNFKMPF